MKNGCKVVAHCEVEVMDIEKAQEAANARLQRNKDRRRKRNRLDRERKKRAKRRRTRKARLGVR